MHLNYVAACAQLACILEASAPKPGNVNRYHDFKDTKYEHFLASGVAFGKTALEAAKRGYAAGKRKIKIEEIKLGELIEDAVEEPKRWHQGANTNLGIAMLLSPLSSAAGFTLAKIGKIRNDELRCSLDLIVKKTTADDAIKLYSAINKAAPGGLGKVKFLDVADRKSLIEIKKNNLNLYDVMKISKNDSIARELTTKMSITFELGYPEIMKHKQDINDAILRCFFKILSQTYDTLIARKNGIKAAKEISNEAKKILEKGVKKSDVEKFDKKLRSRGNKLNPGTTADLTVSSLMVALLNGRKV